MKRLTRFLTSLVTAGFVLVSSLVFSGVAFADSQPACFQYNSSGDFVTSTTPVFNDICNDPTGINSVDGPVPLGNESNFVRIRQDISGIDTSNATNLPLQIGSLTNSCTPGSKFDVWTYIHNDAMSQYNYNGSGPAVANNVKLNISAPGIGTNGQTFNFTSTVSADNAAATVSDTAFLICNNTQQVKLTEVPNSVYYTLNVASPTWYSLPDSTVNGTTNIGNPIFPQPGQVGYQWGCYDYRLIVVYQLTVSSVPTTPPPITPPTTPTPTPPSKLVNTGPGNIIGAFAGFTVAGTAGFMVYTRRKLARN